MKLIFFAVLLSLFGTASFAQQLTGGKTVSFDASAAKSGKLTLTGFVFEPANPPNSAVVLLVSSGGINDAIQGHYGRDLSKAGHLVLAVDSFVPRQILNGTTFDQSQVGSFHMTLDAFDAKRYIAKTYPTIKKFTVMGFSKGGLATMFAADKSFHSNENDRFDSHIAVYPSCAFAARNPKPVGPLLILLGAKDDYSGIDPCVQWSDKFKTAGGKVEIKIYPDAHHSFDGDPSRTNPFYLGRAENFSRCLVLMEDDGRWSYRDKFYTEQLDTYRDLVRSCVKLGATVGTNLRAKASATEDAKSFLAPFLQ